MMFLVALFAVTVVTAIVTLKIDVSSLSFSELLNVIFNKNDPGNPKGSVILVWDLYLPRIASGILAGCALGIAGAVMQCVLRNPLGSPYTLGISNAAAFGASVGIVLGGGMIVGQSKATILISHPEFVTLSAFAFAMLATCVIILLVKMTKVNAETMVLSGVALGSIFSAGISALQYMYNDSALSAIVFWQFGSVGKASWNELGLVAVITVAVVSYFMWKRWDYNAMDAGTDVARSLGINVDRVRVITLFASALVTAVVVSFMGVIAFIGLLGPHIVRMFIGNDNRYVLPGSMMFGALILLIADCVGQNMMSFTLPVGIITSFLGGPLFIWLLIRGRGRKGVAG
jgi:iron complex transport system permease protein